MRTAEAAPGKVGKGMQGEAPRANSTPNGAPHLELGRGKLKTWGNISKISIGETTWPSYLHNIYLMLEVPAQNFRYYTLYWK